ncbi:MAG TPA: ATP-dependent DNA ligase [Methylomirabilota bacterium]|nr:ATP-dependent DNA ligase [Methylomirabilota bacterium]
MEVLELKPPLPPMEALSVDELPEGPEWQYEPKWDGFRCLVFRDGDEVQLQSKSGQPLARYFPEVVEAVRALKPKQFVLDSELVIPEGQGLSFDKLLLRLHPAESRVKKLAAADPALVIVFDLLADAKGKSLLRTALKERRAALEDFAKHFEGHDRLRLSPATTDIKTARKWLAAAGESLDGIMAKRLDFDYRSGDRTGMVKHKTYRSADCVVGGFRYAAKKKVVGSLLLGLFADDGLLHHVGFCSGIKAAEKAALTKQLEGLVKPPGFTGKAPGGPSRWAPERDTEWQPLAHKLVVEVTYDHFSGGRFRHGTGFMRWRPDKAPEQCTYDQVLKNKSGALKLLK